jgi:cell wall-associated NlpC family hydrolase
MMSRRTILRGSTLVLPASLLAACAQGTYAVSTRDVISTVILAGEVISKASGGATSGGSVSRGRIPASPAPTATASRVLNEADKYIGVKYVWGGNTPKSGFDCSGFAKYVFARQGITLPRTSREQAKVGRAVSVDFGAMEPGDLMFFAEPGEAISHVAIYVGNGEIIQASSAIGSVNYMDLNGSRSDWYIQNLVAVRRVM